VPRVRRHLLWGCSRHVSRGRDGAGEVAKRGRQRNPVRARCCCLPDPVRCSHRWINECCLRHGEGPASRVFREALGAGTVRSFAARTGPSTPRGNRDFGRHVRKQLPPITTRLRLPRSGAGVAVSRLARTYGASGAWLVGATVAGHGIPRVGAASLPCGRDRVPGWGSGRRPVSGWCRQGHR